MRGAQGGREENACQETIVFFVFNIHQANVKILIGPSSKHVNHSLKTIIRLAEINIMLLSNLLDLSVIIYKYAVSDLVRRDEISI